MNSLFRPILRSCAVRHGPLASRFRPTPIARPAFMGLTSTFLHARHVASQVSNRPGSQTFEHAATNVKEEIGNSAVDLAKVIAGANVTKDNIIDEGGNSFIGITSKIAQYVPRPILVLGLVGGLPYIGAAGTTVYLARQAELATEGVATGMDPGVAITVLDQALNLQVTYGAVMLSFLGAMHWGMEIAGYGGQKGYARLALGVAPMLVAWPTLGMQPTMALVAQWLGFGALWYADSTVTMLGWAPKWYSQYRFYLTVLVGTCILGSLAGISYWGPVGGHGLFTHDLNELREARMRALPSTRGTVKAPVEAVPAPPESDHFILVHKKAE